MSLEDKSYQLWIERGKCGENVWLWGLLPFGLLYSYYKVGKTEKGFLILGVAIVLNIISAVSYFVFFRPLPIIGIILFVVLIYGLSDTYSIGKKFKQISDSSVNIVNLAEPKISTNEDKSYELWLQRGKYNGKKVVLWGLTAFIIPFMILEPYHRVGRGWTGAGILVVFAILVLIGAGTMDSKALGFLAIIYGIYDTYHTAEKYTKMLSESNPKNEGQK